MSTSAETGQRDKWWRTAVIYQVYPRSFADSDGDGMGDLPGITSRLRYLKELGVDAIWLSPFYRSPQVDAGYDVSDPFDVDPLFGTLADAETLIASAHQRGLRIIVDIVPNHCSDQHPRFRAAIEAGPGSAEREEFIFRDGKGTDGSTPPNAWAGTDDGSAWTRVIGADGRPEQWYLHLFDKSQPDWNWENPAVIAYHDDVLHFWLEKGVDGFRVDVSHGMVKAAGLPDYDPGEPSVVMETRDPATRPPMWDQDGVHEIHRRWRGIVDRYDGDRILVAEAWLHPDRSKLYVRSDEMHQSFNFHHLVTEWDADELKDEISTNLEANGSVGAATTWVLSNHDVIRHASRLGYPRGTQLPYGIGAQHPQPDRELGLRRARAATQLMLALPGSCYLYQGEELGLPEVTDLPESAIRDYHFFATHGRERGRDGCRVPLPWQSSAPAFGFSPSGESWLPQPTWFSEFSVDAQESDPASTLSFYRRAIELRRTHGLSAGKLNWFESAPGVISFDVTTSSGRVAVLANTTDDDRTVPLPSGTVLLTSDGGRYAAGTRQSLRANSSIWILRT